MCGIAGIAARDGEAADPRVAARMIATIRHRGPDDEGVQAGGSVALAHARLSIIDLESGDQPMANEDRSVWITFNGEIFNYIELRERLVAAGHRFATSSDTEVILHLYEELGDECVRELNGQWAFAIHDARKGRLLLSRDRLGIRPLFYTIAGGSFVFASEIKAILEHPDAPRRLDPRGLDQVFTFWTTLPGRTVFDGIRELPPAHSMSVEGSEVRVWRHWDLGPGEAASPGEPPEAAADRLMETLSDAVRLRLRSDVPVGAYLSGGLDSTVTTAIADRLTDAGLRTFSITFDDAEFDESRYQRAAAARLGVEHHALRCSHDDIAAVFPEVVRHAERPILRTAPAPLYLLSRLVHESGFKVVVTGEGADEALGGYDIFKEVKVREFWAADPSSRLRPLLLKRLYPYLPAIQSQSPAYLKRFFHIEPGDLASPFFSHLPRWQTTSMVKAFYSSGMRAALDGYDAISEARALLPPAYERWDRFTRAQFLESAILLPGYILSSQGDRMAMAHSVEGRFPFLDHRLFELALALPVALKMPGLDEKHILKLGAADLVPGEITRRSKQPYRAPDAASFFDGTAGKARRPYVDELLGEARIRELGVFDPGRVEHLVRKAKAGRATGARDSMAVVGILSTQLLIDHFIEKTAPITISDHAAHQ